MKKPSLVIILTIAIFGVQTRAETKGPTTESETVAKVSVRPLDKRPSFWTKTANTLKTSTYLSQYKPYVNRTLNYQKHFLFQDNSLKPVLSGLTEQNPHIRRITIKAKLQNPEDITSESNKNNESANYDVEDKIMKDESFLQLKELAKKVVNETTKYFMKKKKALSRSYQIEEPPQHQLWDDKDQTYHASSFTNAEYEPTSFHHHYIPPPPIHYFPPPQKKDDAVLAKVALIALLKLILAKLKAIGFFKLIMFFLMKIPLMFFKFLFILKGFKLLKLISIPFLVASFAVPFLPLIPLLAPLLFFPLLLIPLLLPLLLPLLFFLPIVPITTPVTASASTRTKRNASSNYSNWTLMDEKWKEYQTAHTTENTAKHFRTRSRPATYENKLFDLKAYKNNNTNKYDKINSYEEPMESTNFIELTQKVVQAQNCLERVACELAVQNDSKIYQAAVIWTLRKVYALAPGHIKQKIEKYTRAYEAGTKRKSSGFCQQEFHCQRPKLFIIQGKEKYNIL